MSYLAAAEERSESLAWKVARKLLVRAKERAIEDVFCASNYTGDYDALMTSAEFFDAMPKLYVQLVLDDFETPGFADIGNKFNLMDVPIISEKYEYASPEEALHEVSNKAHWNYQDLQYAAEVASRLTGAGLSLPCFDDIIGGEK